MTDLRKRAEELGNQPYSEIVLRDRTTDDDYLYVALNPELEGCVVQGETISEAVENLRLFRIDYIEHLLNHNLPIPGPDMPHPHEPTANLPLIPTIILPQALPPENVGSLKIEYA